MTHKLSLTIPSFSTSYEINIEFGLLKNQEKLINYFSSLKSRFAIVTDSKTASLHGEQLFTLLSTAGLETTLFTFPCGESNKTRSTKELLEDQLFEKGLGHDTCLIALGGGVVTDLGGYLAATYCRGIPLVTIPTTLLGMVDASLGGKNGVNTPFGKNLVGCIYQPAKVLIDPSTLQSLPLKELRNGFVEMIKHGLIADAAYFDYLENNADQLLTLHPKLIEKAIFDSCVIKKNIIEEDIKEQGKRNLLNFGHTVGHALENLTHYSLAHGEAVAIGLLVESHLAVQLGCLNQCSFDRIHKILIKFGLPLKLPSKLPLEKVIDTMSLDKKSLKGRPRFVMIEEIGSPLSFQSAYCTQVDENYLKTSLDWMINALCCH